MQNTIEIKERGGTKEKIFNVAVQLFSQQGYDATTVRQIAKGAGVSQPSVYWAYQDKRAILDEILLTYCQKMEENFMTKEEADRLIETSTPRYMLEQCTTFFKGDGVEFLFFAFKIACMEQFTSQLARDIIIGESREKARESIKYVLDLLMSRGKIPDFNTAFLAEEWAQSLCFYSLRWLHYSDNIEMVRFREFNKQIIEVALNGKLP